MAAAADHVLSEVRDTRTSSNGSLTSITANTQDISLAEDVQNDDNCSISEAELLEERSGQTITPPGYVDSNVSSPNSLDGHPISRTDPPKNDVLYSLCVVDDVAGDKNFVRDTPFKGVNLKLQDSEEADAEDSSGTVLKIHAQVESDHLKNEAGNSEHDWWYNRADFDLDKPPRIQSVDYRYAKIKSQRLITALNKIIDYHPDVPDFVFHVFDVHADCYKTLVMYYDDLRCLYLKHAAGCLHDPSAVDGEYNLRGTHINQFWEEFPRPEPECVWDERLCHGMQVLLELIRPHYHRRIAPIVQDLQFNQGRIQFENLWILYKPGTIVYQRRNEKLQGLVVSSTLRFIEDRRYDIEAWYYEYNGRVLRRTSVIEQVSQYEGHRAVQALPFVPAKIYDSTDNGTARAQILARGEKLLRYIGKDFKHLYFESPRTTYRGQIVLDPSEFNDELSLEWSRYRHDEEEPRRDRNIFEFEHGESFKQMSAYLRQKEPRDERGYRRFSDYHEIDPRNATEIERLPQMAMLLLPRLIGGIALGTKKWMRFDVDNIQNELPSYRPKQLEECLVINDEDRELLQTVMMKTALRQETQADFMPGKGEGQIFLLHGPPGTGKTMTAECVANDTGRPLLSLTQSEIGDSIFAETILRRWFTLAARWDAVLIIDEADVFIGKRGDSNVDVTLTTLFLRTLEHYSGILFLTTNRPGKIDDAFISRITAAIRYPALTNTMRFEIWQRFLDMYEKNPKFKVKVTPMAKKALRADETPLNGREIRNVLRTAISLAMLDHQNQLNSEQSETERGPQVCWVDWDHLSKALERHKGFLDYLTSLNKNMDEHKRNAVRANY